LKANLTNIFFNIFKKESSYKFQNYQ